MTFLLLALLAADWVALVPAVSKHVPHSYQAERKK